MPTHRPVTNHNPGTLLAHMCMMESSKHNSPSSKLILNLTQFAMQLIADVDHLSNSIRRRAEKVVEHGIYSDTNCSEGLLNNPQEHGNDT